MNHPETSRLVQLPHYHGQPRGQPAKGLWLNGGKFQVLSSGSCAEPRHPIEVEEGVTDPMSNGGRKGMLFL